MGCQCPSGNRPNKDQVDITHFEIVGAIGKGGFGMVHIVKKKTDPKVGDGGILAMKRMGKAQLMQSEVFIKVAWLERNVLQRTRSLFTPMLYYAFQDNIHLYLVMDFLAGGDLEHHITTHHTFKVEIARFFASEIALGLEDLHRNHIVHHDLKPSNIVLDRQGHARITDFGLATILDPNTDYKTRFKGGTPGFMAPELDDGSEHGIEPDFFSFGATLYYLLKGRPPFKSTEEMIAQKAEPSSWNGIDDGAKDLIQRLMAFNLKNRLTVWNEVKAHGFFSGVDWPQLRKRKGCGPLEIAPNSWDNFSAHVFALDILEPEAQEAVADNNKFAGYEYDYRKAWSKPTPKRRHSLSSAGSSRAISTVRRSSAGASTGEGSPSSPDSQQPLR